MSTDDLPTRKTSRERGDLAHDPHGAEVDLGPRIPPTALDPLDPERFIQAPVSFEERRKANPLMRQPLRPLAGFALHTSGTRLNEQLAAISAEADAAQPSEPGQAGQ